MNRKNLKLREEGGRNGKSFLITVDVCGLTSTSILCGRRVEKPYSSGWMLGAGLDLSVSLNSSMEGDLRALSQLKNFSIKPNSANGHW